MFNPQLNIYFVFKNDNKIIYIFVYIIYILYLFRAFKTERNLLIS
jgi:hypothetical protein